MINQDLVKQFQHIKSGTLSGVLRLEQEQSFVRFYFEEGSLLLLDFGQDKELVMAGHFVELYKIDDTMCTYAKSQYTDQQIPIVETLLKQQLVHQNEVEQVTRYMVEDLLCHVFSGAYSTTWQNAQDVDINSFDINKTTVKIRIEIDMLLTMVQSRIQEREHVQSRIEDWNTVYSIEEDTPPDAQLNEMERNVLSFIDGRQSVKDIARSVRESNINVGIYICSLDTQGFIRKGGIKKSTRIVTATSPDVAVVVNTAPQQPSIAQASAAVASATVHVGADVSIKSAPENEQTAFDEADEKEDPQEQFKVYTGTHTRRQQNTGGGRPIVMIVVLLVVVVVAGLVWSDMKDKRMQEEQREELRHLITQSAWPEAESLLSQAFMDAEDSRSAQRKLKQLVNDTHKSFEKEFTQIEKTLSAGEWEKSKTLAARFPSAAVSRGLEYLWTKDLGNQITELNAEIEAKEIELEDERSSLDESVRNRLRSGNISKAMDLIKNKSDENYTDKVWAAITDSASNYVYRWRKETVRDIEAGITKNNKSYVWLFEQIEKVKMAHPPMEEAKILSDFEETLKERRSQLLQRLNDVPALLATGDYKTADKLLTKLNENIMALSQEKRSQVLGYIGQRNDIELDVNEHQSALSQLLAQTANADALAQASDRAAKDLSSYSALPHKEELQQLLSTAQAISKAMSAETIEDEIALLGGSIQDASLLIPVIEKRISWLSRTVKMASAGLSTIKKQSKEGSLNDAMRSLVAFLDNDNYRRTIVFTEAQELHKSLMERQEKNAKIYKQFEQAILKDDVALVSQLLPQMKVKSLPYVVSSVPNGAKIFLNGEDTGKQTPQLYPPMSNAERADVTFTIKLDGYRDTKMSPFNAEQSWRIHAVLQRKPVVEVQLKQSLNSALVSIDNTLWLSSNKSIWSISQDGTSKEYKLQNNASTIYAPASKVGDYIYVPTRGRSVQRISPNGDVTSTPVSVPSNHAVSYYVSPVIMDMELLILADATDGSIHAVKESDASLQWKVQSKDRVACSPILIDDKILAVYRNGNCKVISADNGNVVQSFEIGDHIINAWTDGQSISGYTSTRTFTWSGGEIQFEDLLKNIVAGGPGVIKTKDNRIRTPNAEGRFDIELGRITEDLTATPVLWNGHAVCPVGNTMIILGPHGFTMSSDKPMLAPILMGDILIIASSDGHVRYLKK